VERHEGGLGQVPGTFRAAGHGGVGYLLDTLTRNETVTLTTGQLRIGGPDCTTSITRPCKAGPDRS
jgi:hypothetical protein